MLPMQAIAQDASVAAGNPLIVYNGLTLNVPEPGALGLLGVAGLFLRRPRRRN